MQSDKPNHLIKQLKNILNKKKYDNQNKEYSENIEEIITRVPSYTLRWGIPLLVGMLVSLLLLSNWIHYPEVIKHIIKINTSQITNPVSVPANCLITEIFVKQGFVVKAGQRIISYKTSTNSDKTYYLNAEKSGEIAFIAIVEKGATLAINQDVFLVNPLNQKFFGVLQIPNFQINKIKIGQNVLINLTNSSNDESRILYGRIGYISNEPSKDGFFNVKVDLTSKANSGNLKSWMKGEATIITKNRSLLQRIFSNVFRTTKS